MSAVFLPSLDLSIVDSNAAVNAPASRVLLDEPGLVARSASTSLSLTFALTGTYDTVGVVRSNLAASGTIRVRAGSVANVSSDIVYDRTFPAWSGAAPLEKAISYLPLGTALTAPYVSIEMTSGATAVEASRVLIGKRIEVDGIDQGPEFGFRSGSAVEDGLGWTDVTEARSRISWKANVGNIKSADYWANWAPFTNRVGKHAGFLFIPDTTSTSLQLQSALVRNVDDPKMVPTTFTRYRVELQLLEV